MEDVGDLLGEIRRRPDHIQRAFHDIVGTDDGRVGGSLGMGGLIDLDNNDGRDPRAFPVDPVKDIVRMVVRNRKRNRLPLPEETPPRASGKTLVATPLPASRNKPASERVRDPEKQPPRKRVRPHGIPITILRGPRLVPVPSSPMNGIPDDAFDGIFDGGESDDGDNTGGPRPRGGQGSPKELGVDETRSGFDEDQMDVHEHFLTDIIAASRGGTASNTPGGASLFGGKPKLVLSVEPVRPETPCPSLGAKLSHRLDNIDLIVDPLPFDHPDRAKNQVELYAYPRMTVPDHPLEYGVAKVGQGRSFVPLIQLLEARKEFLDQSRQARDYASGSSRGSEYDPFDIAGKPRSPPPLRRYLEDPAETQSFQKRPKDWDGVWLVPITFRDISARPVIGQQYRVETQSSRVAADGLEGMPVTVVSRLPENLNKVVEVSNGQTTRPVVEVPPNATWITSGKFSAFCRSDATPLLASATVHSRAPGQPVPSTVFLVEVAPDRQCPGRGRVVRVAPIGNTGIRVGTPVTPTLFPPPKQLDAILRNLVFNAHMLAREVLGTTSVPPRAVVHYINSLGGNGIQVPPGFLRKIPRVENAESTTVTLRDLSHLLAVSRYRQLPASLRRTVPSPAEHARAWLQYLNGESLISTDGDAGVSAFYQPIKPAIESRGPGRAKADTYIKPIVVDPHSAPYASELRSPDILRQKRKQGRRVSDSSVRLELDDLVAAGKFDARNVKPGDAARFDQEIRQKANKSPELVKLIGVVDSIREQSSLGIKNWDNWTSERWAQIRMIQQYVQDRQSHTDTRTGLRKFVEGMKEAEGVCSLRLYTLVPAVGRCLLREVGIRAPDPERDAWLGDSRPMKKFYLRWATPASPETLCRAWESLSGRRYARGAPHGRQFGLPTLTDDPSGFSPSVLDDLDASTRGAAVEVVECAILASRLARGCRMAIDGGHLNQGGADLEDHLEARKKLALCQSILRATLAPSILHLANKTWRLDTPEDPL